MHGVCRSLVQIVRLWCVHNDSSMNMRKSVQFRCNPIFNFRKWTELESGKLITVDKLFFLFRHFIQIIGYHFVGFICGHNFRSIGKNIIWTESSSQISETIFIWFRITWRSNRRGNEKCQIFNHILWSRMAKIRSASWTNWSTHNITIEKNCHPRIGIQSW